MQLFGESLALFQKKLGDTASIAAVLGCSRDDCPFILGDFRRAVVPPWRSSLALDFGAGFGNRHGYCRRACSEMGWIAHEFGRLLSGAFAFAGGEPGTCGTSWMTSPVSASGPLRPRCRRISTQRLPAKPAEWCEASLTIVSEQWGTKGRPAKLSIAPSWQYCGVSGQRGAVPPQVVGRGPSAVTKNRETRAIIRPDPPLSRAKAAPPAARLGGARHAAFQGRVLAGLQTRSWEGKWEIAACLIGLVAVADGAKTNLERARGSLSGAAEALREAAGCAPCPQVDRPWYERCYHRPCGGAAIDAAALCSRLGGRARA